MWFKLDSIWIPALDLHQNKATYNCPCEKAFLSFTNKPTLSKVWPWNLFIVIAKTNRTGNCEGFFPQTRTPPHQNWKFEFATIMQAIMVKKNSALKVRTCYIQPTLKEMALLKWTANDPPLCQNWKFEVATITQEIMVKKWRPESSNLLRSFVK